MSLPKVKAREPMPCACADDADAVVGRHHPIDAFKQDFGAVVFSRNAELDHGG
jgi:hypothetical protein